MWWFPSPKDVGALVVRAEMGETLERKGRGSQRSRPVGVLETL